MELDLTRYRQPVSEFARTFKPEDVGDEADAENLLDATLEMRSFLFEAVYENQIATAEFKKADGILRGLWDKVHERPDEFLDRRIIDDDGLDVAARDFLAGMTDRFAVTLYERLFIPKPWVGPMAWNQL